MRNTLIFVAGLATALAVTQAAAAKSTGPAASQQRVTDSRALGALKSGRAAGRMASGIVTTKHGSFASVAFASVALTVGGLGPSPLGPSAVTTH